MSLKALIVEEITLGGPMPFERFMETALYSSGGFFGGATLRSQRSGDFLTSPEVSALFGQTLAEHVRRERERIGEPFLVVEAGSGSGSLLRGLLEVADVPALAVEISPAAREAIGASLPEVRVDWRLPAGIRGVVIANELLDNLPMALAQRMNGVWRERWVGADDGDLVFVDAEPRPEVLGWLDHNAGDVPEGGWVEVQLAAQTWLSDVIERLDAGSVLIFDYGDLAENLSHRRQEGTLRTYRAHHLGPDPLDAPGETDVTADVNFTPLLRVAQDAGLDAVLWRQDDFLTSLGLRGRLSSLRQEELEAARAGRELERLRLRTMKIEAETLLHPRGLGDFRVLICAKEPR